MKFSVLGTGRMAGKMADTTIAHMDDVRAYAAASRSPEKARDFAAAHGFEKAYGSYEELLADPETELVYVATPHSEHYANAKDCLLHGKHVLMEKAFTMNAAQAEELIALSEEKHLLLAEAIWTRYMPSRQILTDLLASGVIGRVHSMTANLGYPVTHKARLTDPALGGGALLDVGVYPLHLALMVMQSEVTGLSSTAVLYPTGVDAVNSTTLRFADGAMAVLNSSMCSMYDSEANIYGEKGFLQIQNVNNPEEIRLYDNHYQFIERYEIPREGSGYVYEIRACMQAIAEGRTECPQMPHSEILRVMRLLDRIRESWAQMPSERDFDKQ